MKLYALTIGINSYLSKPLRQCLKDVEKITNYLSTIESFYDEIIPIPLLEKDASKKNITAKIKELSALVSDEDVVLIYFSGHGAQERTGGRFPTEHDGALECLVCMPTEEAPDDYLLADKEIRYLLSKFENNPHIVTLFDCCHSGDIVRDGFQNGNDGIIKRLDGYYKARSYDKFIFHHEILENDLKINGLANSIPFQNHVHLAACTSSQSSWEDNQGGVFTRYLLRLLASTNNQINYQEITRWAKISLRDITEKQQTPTYSIQGEGKVDGYSRWLGLPVNPTVQKMKKGAIIFNQEKGWYYTRGEVLGVKEGLKLTIAIDENKKIEATVIETDANFSLISDPLLQGHELDPEVAYEVITDQKSIYNIPLLYVNDIDGIDEMREQVEALLKSYPFVKFTTNKGDADYYANIFNQLLYISLPEWEFRPLATQIDLVENNMEQQKNMLHNQLGFLNKYHHFDILENPDEGFDNPPIKVEVRKKDTTNWTDTTNGIFKLQPNSNRNQNGELFQEYNVKITNVTDGPLHIGVLSLYSDFEINADPLDRETIELGANESKNLYYYKTGKPNDMYISLEPYMEIYNWPYEFVQLKFIINNFENFSDALKDFEQIEADKPFLITKDTNGNFIRSLPRGGGSSEDFEKVENKWGTVKTTIQLKNTTQNTFSGALEDKELLKAYFDDDMISPFMMYLYYDVVSNGMRFNWESKPNVTGEEINDKSIPFKTKMKLGNKIENLRRRRKFLTARLFKRGKPIIVAEGDSWFCFPLLVKDIIDHVMKKYPVRSLAAAGDELEDYFKNPQLIKTVKKLDPDYVLISGGGNDIIGEEIEGLLIEQMDPGLPAEQYVNGDFQISMNRLEKLYKLLFKKLNEHNQTSPNPFKQIFIHGYDYVRATNDPAILKSGWVNKFMSAAKIEDLGDRKRVINYLIDTFNVMLERIAEAEPLVTYLNIRGKVTADHLWRDEIHPTSKGFKPMGQAFIDAIKEIESTT